MASKRETIQRAQFGMRALIAMTERAQAHMDELVKRGVALEEIREQGFSSKAHAYDCGFHPREVHDALDAVLNVARATKRSLAQHLNIHQEDNLPRVATISVNSDELHLLVYAFMGYAAEFAGQDDNEGDAYMKFHNRTLKAGIPTLVRLAETLTTILNSVCTGDN